MKEDMSQTQKLMVKHQYALFFLNDILVFSPEPNIYNYLRKDLN